MGKVRSSLVLRFLSVLVLLPIVLSLLWVGGWWFFGLIAVLMVLATWEYVRMLSHLGYHPSYPFALALVCVVLLVFHLGDTTFLQPAVAALLICSLAWHVFGDKTDTRIENWLLPLAGALYISWTSGYMLALRALPGGAYRLFVSFAITWAADSGAYFCGRTWGRHHMAPRLSPNKTWEGYAGGVVAGLIAGVLFLGFGELGWVHGAVLGLLLSVISPLGDLGVSMIKRQVGVKDSGKLIPGHGGVFDRADSLFVTVVVAYMYQVYVMGALATG